MTKISKTSTKTKKLLPTLKVTLDAFSGRTNPSWVLTPSQTKEFFEFSGWQDMIVTKEMERKMDFGLNGFVISNMTDIDLGLPQTFRIMNYHKRFPDVRNFLKPQLELKEMASRELWLLKTAPKDVEAKNQFPRFESYMKKTKMPKKIKRKKSGTKMKVPKREGTCVIELTAYLASLWNRDNYIKVNNNCYNYAARYASGTLAQPGRISDYVWTTVDCDHVFDAAQSDGLIIWDDTICDSDKTYFHVCLVIDPGYDFHWYREHPDCYGHKPGSTDATKLDACGKIITNPEDCERDYRSTGGADYTKFCGYYLWPVGTPVN